MRTLCAACPNILLLPKILALPGILPLPDILPLPRHVDAKRRLKATLTRKGKRLWRSGTGRRPWTRWMTTFS